MIMEKFIVLFYVLSVMFIMFEFLQLICRKELQTRMKEQEERIKKAEKQRRNLRSDEYDKALAQIFVMDLVYVAWAFIGLFSSQWPLFIALCLLTAIPRLRTMRVANNLLSIVLLAMIAANKFYCIVAFPTGLYGLLF